MGITVIHIHVTYISMLEAMGEGIYRKQRYYNLKFTLCKHFLAAIIDSSSFKLDQYNYQNYGDYSLSSKNYITMSYLEQI